MERTIESISECGIWGEDILKIFLVLGTQKFQFNRLLKQVDDLLGEGKLNATVFAQVGNSDYTPRNYTYQKFLNKEDFEKQIQTCDVLITHSGVGSIVTGIQSNKPVVVYPRLKKYGEHIDDHQVEIAKAYSKKGYIILCSEFDRLEDKIEEAKSFRMKQYISSREEINTLIDHYLMEWKIGDELYD